MRNGSVYLPLRREPFACLNHTYSHAHLAKGSAGACACGIEPRRLGLKPEEGFTDPARVISPNCVLSLSAAMSDTKPKPTPDDETKWRAEFTRSGETEIRDAMNRNVPFPEAKRQFAFLWLREQAEIRRGRE
jgi:hypothetical protein